MGLSGDRDPDAAAAAVIVVPALRPLLNPTPPPPLAAPNRVGDDDDGLVAAVPPVAVPLPDMASPIPAAPAEVGERDSWYFRGDDCVCVCWC